MNDEKILMVIPKDTTVKDIIMILSGNLDNIPIEKFMYIGSLKDGGIIG